ncbi:MAG: hypothetical protein J5988_12950 [Eubacterium sp.]|nr:hypothetical protein [Eubacterium sp.]
MKHTKKLLSLLMTLVMALSLTTGFTTKTATAAQQLTVTLRVEQDATTLLAPVKITLTEADKKDFGIGLSTETLTPLHALAKYLQTEKKVSDEDMKNYISHSTGWISSIKISDTDNGTSSNIDQTETSWMFAVNNKSNIVNEEASKDSDYAINYSSYAYPLKDDESITFYGVWWGDYVKGINSYYAAFDKEIYKATSKKEVTVSLKQCGIYDTDNTFDACANATVIASQNGNPVPTKYDIKGTTDKNGTVNLQFPSAGTYTLSAYREISVENDNNTTTKHYDISRPYAVVTVTDEQVENPPAKQEQTITQQKENTSTTTTATVRKPAKVTKLKATVKKSKKTKKSVKLSWKKATNAKGYEIYVKKNAKKKLTKKTTVKKNKATIKLAKGSYQIKVRAYNKSGSTTKKGSFSKSIKVKVK